jgi:hypothetical protein
VQTFVPAFLPLSHRQLTDLTVHQWDVAPRTTRKGHKLKTNINDPESAKLATGKGVLQGYTA